MQTLLPAWDTQLPLVSKPCARLINVPRVRPDLLAIEHARRKGQRAHGNRCSGTTGTWSELMWVNTADFTAFNNSSAEGSLLAGVNDQPTLPALFFFNKQGRGRAVRLVARGVISNTSTPTIIFQWRFGTTLGSSFLSGTSVGVSVAITTAATITNKWWESTLELVCNVPGLGAGNTTLSGTGNVKSPGAFASPFDYALEPTTPDTATWTATLDNSVTQYVNLSVTWSAANASNTITCKQLMMWGMN